MADESNWTNHVSSPQRGSVTENVNVRRYGNVHTLKGSDNHEAKDDEEAYDDYGIPTGI